MLDRLLSGLKTHWRLVAAAFGVAVVVAAAGAVVGIPPPFTAALLLAFGLATWAIHRWRSGRTDSQASGRGLVSSGTMAAVAVIVLAQAVPYGRAHSNPPVTGEPDWATAETRVLMVRACFDCHSNEVVWPWYANVAPFSWAATWHVDDGREAVNYSEWDRPQDEADETLETIEDGSMPPAFYTVLGLHSHAKLTDAELQTLIEGVSATPGLTE